MTRIALVIIGVWISGCVVESQPPKEVPVEYIKERADKAELVLRVICLEKEGGSKYHWDKVKILKELRNVNGIDVPSELRVAHYGLEPGIPEGESTIYLERYNPKKLGTWALLGRSAKLGVSHSRNSSS